MAVDIERHLDMLAEEVKGYKVPVVDLIAVQSRDPFKVGLGLLTFQAGFGILLATFEQSLSVAALVGVVNLLTALAIAYLTTARTAFFVEDDIA